MSSAELTNTDSDWKLPSQRKVGMICLIITESALFTIFVVAYVWYMGKSLNGPFPKEVLHVPWLASIALFGSSFTVTIAEKFLHKGNRALFHVWWLLTIALGAYFVYFTGAEWYHLIYKENLTISTNVFGSTFYALVGLHASHVIIGLILLSIVVISSFRGKLDPGHSEHVEMIAWYWHFVDAIWVVVLTLVYFISVNY
ncbi:cytochrome c oxidase subunit 3 [Terrimicrobium sacchariphilum]|uniref:Cytochrome c oxidase subunit 3 n=1 Tax=Terrimicrobium sacchariphilum TaxID=690879 RepID=A0A146GDA3_TERSA|nr:heme-copper oxidase subunit III [Terrimicrobium sacchariphilum]GAT34508.1 cytochrome c oxidase subunit 3 [Terrimicrobium sacchariphilum]